MNVLIVDPDYTRRSVDTASLERDAVGGSEASMVLVADALSAHHDVWVVQSARSENASYGAAKYVTSDFVSGLPADMFDAVIVVRAIKEVASWKTRFAKARIYLWCHDYLAGKRRKYASKLARADCRVVAVSHTHAGHLAAVLGNGFFRGYDQRKRQSAAQWPVTTIYNPIQEHLRPKNCAVDVRQLIFCSAPRKRLLQTLRVFAAIRERLPGLRLLVAQPWLSSLQRLR